jgi:hypothetical protein
MRTVIEVDASVLSNLCADMPCGGIDCRECASHSLRSGDELVLRVKGGGEDHDRGR